MSCSFFPSFLLGVDCVLGDEKQRKRGAITGFLDFLIPSLSLSPSDSNFQEKTINDPRKNENGEKEKFSTLVPFVDDGLAKTFPFMCFYVFVLHPILNLTTNALTFQMQFKWKEREREDLGMLMMMLHRVEESYYYRYQHVCEGLSLCFLKGIPLLLASFR